MREPKFCKACKIKLDEGFLGLKPQYYQFEDGCYCVRCSRVRVEKARKEI